VVIDRKSSQLSLFFFCIINEFPGDYLAAFLAFP